MKKPKIIFLTGAGISAESGIQTFRDSKDGLWENYKIEEVCTSQAWDKNPEVVLAFYNERKRQCVSSQPNLAHELIAKLEDHYEVIVVTQNVDNLHERAGSTRVIHLHGELLKVRSTVDTKLVYHTEEDTFLGDKCELGGQLRPHIVFFGEGLDDDLLDKAIASAFNCSVCVIVGTSMQVYPANSLPYYVPYTSEMVFIDPLAHTIDIDDERIIYTISEKATIGMQMLYDSLIARLQ